MYCVLVAYCELKHRPTVLFLVGALEVCTVRVPF